MTTDRIVACRAALVSANIPVEVEPDTVRRKSRDFYWYSPVLKRQLGDVVGDFVAMPDSEKMVRTILEICFAHNVPVTPRGKGTGNYGQAMPLCGGCILDLSAMASFKIGETSLTTEPGAILYDLENACREVGKEIRLFPSTAKTASVGGFIAGGASGVGAIRWGGLRNPDNILRLKCITMEAEPRVIELAGHEAHKIAHAYGVTGIITELELPIDPMTEWIGVFVSLPDLASAIRCGVELGTEVLCRMISVFEPGIAENYFLRHRDHLKAGEAQIACYVAPQDLSVLEEIAAKHRGLLRYRDGQNPRRMPPLFELGWNHTTLRAMKVDPSLTYLQMMGGEDPIADCAAIKARFGDELMLHFELTRIMGQVRCVGLPLVRYSTEARLEDIITILENELTISVFNPHRVTLEEGGMKQVDQSQLDFKKQTDPKGLLNPGKMIAWENPDWTNRPGRNYLFSRGNMGKAS